MTNQADAPAPITPDEIEKAISMPAVIDPMTERFAPAAKPQMNARMGVPGYSISGGYVLSRETDRRLGQKERYRVYAENITNVAIVGVCIRMMLETIAGAKWTITPKDPDNSAAVEAAEFIEEVLFEDMRTPWFKVIRRAATARFYGFSVQEKIFKTRDDGRIGLRSIDMRPAATIERWDIDPKTGEVRSIAQRNPNNGMECVLPVNKVLYVVDDTLSDSPEGLGLLRQGVRGADGIKRFEDLEHWGFEQDLNGVPVGRAPLAALREAVENGDISEEASKLARSVIESFITNHIKGQRGGVLLDSEVFQTTDDKKTPTAQRMWDVEVLKSESSGFDAINNSIKRKTWELAVLMGGEHLLLGTDGAGSLALAQTSIQRMHGMANSLLSEIAHEVRLQVIDQLCELNNIPRELRPKATPEKIAYRSISEVVEALVGMSNAGSPLMPTDPAVGEVRDQLGLSRPDTRDTIMAGLLAMGATSPQPGDEPGEEEDEPAPKGDGKAPAKKPSQAATARPGGGGRKPAATVGGKDPASALLGELNSYVESQRAPAQ